MNEIKIRKAALKDIPELSALASRTYADTFGHTMTADELKKALVETRSEKYFTLVFNKDVLLVAEENGELIGYIQFGRVEIKSIEATNQDRELKRIYIDKNNQGKGIGKKLMDAMLEYPEMKSANKIYLDVWAENDKAIGLYVKYGFTVIGETDFTVDDQVVGKDTVMMLSNNKR